MTEAEIQEAHNALGREKWLRAQLSNLDHVNGTDYERFRDLCHVLKSVEAYAEVCRVMELALRKSINDGLAGCNAVLLRLGVRGSVGAGGVQPK